LHRRVAALETGLPILAAQQGPLNHITIVRPAWERSVGDLVNMPMAEAKRWLSKRLAGLKIPGLIAIGSFEASLNCEQNGEMHWAGELQLIVAGATRQQLREALRIGDRERKSRPHQRILDVRPVKTLARTFAYTQKRLVEARHAYVSETNGRQHRRHLPPKPKYWAEFDGWLFSLPLGARTIVFGCARRGLKIYARR
jgi:hypothetical protein